jgi:hypothetical protein
VVKALARVWEIIARLERDLLPWRGPNGERQVQQHVQWFVRRSDVRAFRVVLKAAHRDGVRRNIEARERRRATRDRAKKGGAL